MRYELCTKCEGKLLSKTVWGIGPVYFCDSERECGVCHMSKIT